MSDATAKQLALRALEQLPEDATLEDAMERLYLLEKIERGRADLREGRAVPHEEVVARFGLRQARGVASVQIRWSAGALRDLEELHDYIAGSSPRYAALVAGRLVAAVDAVREYPELGRMVPELGAPLSGR